MWITPAMSTPKPERYWQMRLGLVRLPCCSRPLLLAWTPSFFGWRALGAYRAGDLDSAGVHAGLAGASLAYARVSLEAKRALPIARTAVLAGDAQALATGLRILSLPLRLTLLGLAITIIAGLVTLFFTQDKSLEQWFKQTRFGNRPAEMNAVQNFTYAIAKRRSRSRWPELISERLEPDGPTTRLVDLEQQVAGVAADKIPR